MRWRPNAIRRIPPEGFGLELQGPSPKLPLKDEEGIEMSLMTVLMVGVLGLALSEMQEGRTEPRCDDQAER